jgi:hypothetical protein
MNPKAPRMNLVAAPRVGRGKSVAQTWARRRTDYRRLWVLKRAHAKAVAPSGIRIILKIPLGDDAVNTHTTPPSDSSSAYS